MSYAATAMQAEQQTDVISRPATINPFNILLVEDDASDVMLAEIALDATQLDYELHTLPNGSEVLSYLCGRGKYGDKPRPDVMMLDLSLPTKDGFEVLAELSENPQRHGNLPIVILTGDTHSAFLRASYGLNIAAYVIKPCSASKIRDAMLRVQTRRA